MVKRKDDTPPGGWESPGTPDPNRVFERYASGSKTVRGKLQWIWKPIDAKYLKAVAERKAEIMAPPAPKPPAPVRLRTRK